MALHGFLTAGFFVATLVKDELARRVEVREGVLRRALAAFGLGVL